MDLFARAGDADDDRLPPALVRAGERLAHDLDVADALERVVDSAVGELHNRLGHVIDFLGIDKFGGAKLLGELELRGIRVDGDDAIGTGHHRALHDREPDSPEPEDRDCSRRTEPSRC